MSDELKPDYVAHMTEEQKARVEFVKQEIATLSRLQDMLFNGLVTELNPYAKKDEEWLFDYIFNDSSYVSFEEYLKNYNGDFMTYHESLKGEDVVNDWKLNWALSHLSINK
jgi:hypothetical protein